MLGLPTIVPFKYPSKGELSKKVSGKDVVWGERRTGFYCKSNEPNEEILGILGKFLESSKKCFDSTSNQSFTKEGAEKPVPSQLALVIKNTIQKKLQYYKIYHLSYLIRRLVVEEDFDPTDRT